MSSRQCPNCGKRMDASWVACPYCARQDQAQKGRTAAAFDSMVEAPMAEPRERQHTRVGDASLPGDRKTEFYTGYEPAAVRSLAVLTGSAESVRAVEGFDELAALIDLSEISRAPAKFDEHELEQLNARLIHEMPYEAVRSRLADLDADDGGAFWLAVRGNLVTLADASDWWRIVAADIDPVIENADLTTRAAALLPPEPWDATTWSALTSAVSKETGLKGRALFHPLRLALTGRDAGPELKALLPLIGKARAEARLVGRRG